MDGTIRVLIVDDSAVVVLRAELQTAWRGESRDAPDDERITNGAGFVGSIARFTTPWPIPGSALAAVGLADGQRR